MGWRRYVRRAQHDVERAEELEAYLLEEIDDNIARGLSPGEARRRAHLKLGNPTRIREEIYEMNTLRALETAWQDVRYGARLLRRNPTFAVVAILTLALGIGANAAMFQLLNAVRFQPLPVHRPGELAYVDIDRHGKGRVGVGYRRGVHTEPLWQALRERQQAFSSIAAWGTDRWDLSTGGEFTPAQGLYVSGSYFGTLGVRPYAGRLLGDADDSRGCGTPGAVLSHAFWLSRYAGDRGVIGQSLTLNRQPFEIVGVAPAGFFGLEVGRTFDVAVPLCAEPLIRGSRAATGRPHVWWLEIMGRLAPGWSLEQAAAHLQAISRPIFETTVSPTYTAEMAENYRANDFTAVSGATGVSTLRTEYATHLWLLLGATGLVLLITCVNLANLMVARATSRQKEIAVRLAIGASRRRVVRQMLTESVLIAAIAVATGAFIATWLSGLLVTLLSTEGNRLFLNLTPDWRMFAFLTAIAGLACVLFGVTPALRATQADPARALHGTGRSATDLREALALRRGLVVLQVAFSMVLVISALLFARSLQNLSSVDIGFRTDTIAAYVDLAPGRVPPERRPQLLAEIAAGLRAVPGVQYAAEAYIVPLSGPEWNMPIIVRGVRQEEAVYFNAVGVDYFRALGTPLLAGRTFDERDAPGGPRTAVVTEAFARRYFEGRDAIGQSIHVPAPPGTPQPVFEIVGIVGNSKYNDVREEFPAVVYLAMAQEADVPSPLSLVLRTDLPLGSVAPALTSAITAAAPGATVSYDPLSQYVRELLRTDRLMTTLAGVFGGLALVIAVVGLYGVMSYMVARRTVEIGIRMALGAEPRGIVRMVLAESGLLVLAGGFIGALLAVAAARYATQLLYGVDALDPASFALAIGALGAVGLLAGWIPARRASKVAPTVALRD